VLIREGLARRAGDEGHRQRHERRDDRRAGELLVEGAGETCGDPYDAAKAKAGADIADKALCGSCHLPDYRGQNQVPRLAGQNEAFLNWSLRMFRDNPGPGRDTIMAATLRGMTDADLANLAHYFATYKRSCLLAFRASLANEARNLEAKNKEGA